MNPLKVGSIVYFNGERLPYNVMAISERYAVVSRKLNKHEDADLLRHEVNVGAYPSIRSAYKSCKDRTVYSLIDFTEGVKAPDNLIFGIYDYFDEEDCQAAIAALESGEMHLSKRKCDFSIDMERTGLSK